MDYRTGLCFRFIVLVLTSLNACSVCSAQSALIRPDGMEVSSRFLPPSGYQRTEAKSNSFAHYLQSLPLKPAGSNVLYYNGSVKQAKVHDAVINIDVGTRDLQQCADAVIRLRAEYLYAQGRYNDISFNFTNGFKAEYSRWMQGQRIVVSGSQVRWTQSAAAGNSYKSFRVYLDMVFAYAGTLSLAKSLKSVSSTDVMIGDVFIQGGSPGHAIIVVDMAEKDGEKVVLLAQSYMPAQEIHVLKNPQDPMLSPWYKVGATGVLQTPEWTFKWSELKRF